MHGVSPSLMEEFIAEITGLSTAGIKFKKETKISNAALKKFPKWKLVKNGNFPE